MYLEVSLHMSYCCGHLGLSTYVVQLYYYYLMLNRSRGSAVFVVSVQSFYSIIYWMLIMQSFRSRKENLERAREHEAAGNSRAAFDCYQKAVDITPKIALELIQVQM